MQRDIEDNFWNLIPRMAGQLTGRSTEWMPATDIHEDGDRFVLKADLPGLRAEDIEITVENGTLAIKGERKFEREDESGNYRRFERVEGSFQRNFTLPETADPEQITASSKDGVLELVIQKRATSQPKRIAVHS